MAANQNSAHSPIFSRTRNKFRKIYWHMNALITWSCGLFIVILHGGRHQFPGGLLSVCGFLIQAESSLHLHSLMRRGLFSKAGTAPPLHPCYSPPTLPPVSPPYHLSLCASQLSRACSWISQQIPSAPCVDYPNKSHSAAPHLERGLCWANCAVEKGRFSHFSQSCLSPYSSAKKQDQFK